MSSSSSSISVRHAVRRAVRHIRRVGIGGPRPIDELQTLVAAGKAVSETLQRALGNAADDDLAATVHLIRILDRDDLATSVAEAVLRRPAPFDAKVEAVELLRESGLDIPAPVEATLQQAHEFLAAPSVVRLQGLGELGDAWRIPILSHWLRLPNDTDVELLLAAADLEPELRFAVIERLGESGDVAAVPPLREMVDGQAKGLRKVARRALHRLRSAGVEVDVSNGENVTAFSLQIAPDTRREARAFITGVDGSGARILWLLTPSPTAGERLLEAVIDDNLGLRKAEVMTVTRKGFRAHLDKLQTNPAILVAATDVVHVVGLLAAAEARADSAEVAPAGEYVEWRDGVAKALFEPRPGKAEPPIYAHLSLQEVGEDRDALKGAVELLGKPYFGNWALRGDAAVVAARGVRDAETSKLVVDEEQRKQQVDHAISAAAEAFDSELRSRYRQRLEEMAMVLWTPKRSEQARLALAAGIGFTEVSDLYSDHPFARALIQRGVLVAYQSLRESEETESSESSESRIVRP